MDEATIDQIICGEQQPESDHFIQYQNSWTGFTDDVHWRECGGWFSYSLKNKDANAKKVCIEYFDRDKNRAFSIWINNKKVKCFIFEGDKADEKLNFTFDLDEEASKTDAFDIKFVSEDDQMSSKIINIRLMK